MPDTFWSRMNQESAGNNAINLESDIAPILLTFVASGPSGDTVLSDTGGVDPNTQVVIDGVAYNFQYIVYGTLPLNNNKIPDQFEGDPVVIIRVLNYPSSGSSERFVFLPESDATEAEMAAFQQGNITPDGVGTLPPVPVCFLSGTLVATPNGPKRVDDLVAGDLVETADRGAQPLVWVTLSDHVWTDSDTRHKPIEIKAGALGDGLPLADVCVSPQHHMLIEGPLCEWMFGHAQVLAPAKGLTGLPGVRVMAGKKSSRYFHLLLAQHELLQVSGSWSESFYPGPQSIQMLSRSQRDELIALIPGVIGDSVEAYGETVRPRITRRQAELFVDQMLQNGALAEISLAG